MPFYPSPNRDDGYDISDFYGVDPRLGTLGDFVEFVRTASRPRDPRDRSTSSSTTPPTSTRGSRSRAPRATRPSAPSTSGATSRPTSPRASPSPTRRRRTGSATSAPARYYLHRFYRHQPDLNVANARVRDELTRIVGFWLALGVSGLPHGRGPVPARARRASPSEVDGDAKGWLRELRAFAGRRRGDAVLLGEVNAELQDLSRYFGDEDGDALHMQFAFLLNQHLWLSLAREEAEPLEAGHPQPAARPARQRVGDVPAQPRRAQPRQAHGSAARGGLRRLRPRRGRCRCTATACAGARRRCSAATGRGCGWPGA